MQYGPKGCQSMPVLEEVNALWTRYLEDRGEKGDFRRFIESVLLQGVSWQCGLRDRSFLPIVANGHLYYGGDQDWWAKRHFRLAGCGTMAAADITAYTARAKGWQGLYAGENAAGFIAKQDFLQHMDAVIACLTPTMKGIPYVGYFQQGFERFVCSRGYRVESWCSYQEKCKPENALVDALAYLLPNLMADRPLACIHWFGVPRIRALNPEECGESYSNMNWHWVVISGLAFVNGRVEVSLSSEGKLYRFDLQDFLQGRPYFLSAEIKKN